MSNKLVAYFSATGKTECLAKQLAETVDADLFEIKPQIPYTEADLNWEDPNSRSTIEMKDHVNLHLESNATLLGSEKWQDYPEHYDAKHVNVPMLPRWRSGCLIFADECEHISITGTGTIDCNGKHFVTKREGEFTGWAYVRKSEPTPPRAVFLTGCRDVRIEDVKMINQPSGWSYWIHDCDYVHMTRLDILADVNYPNNDGIHINASRHVTVSDCNITCGDDCIVLRANNVSLAENKVCEKVTVTNCTLTSRCSGIPQIGQTKFIPHPSKFYHNRFFPLRQSQMDKCP